ncbi:GTP-binding protein HSR1 [candidate division LCP-89 bacterium B3_LCP]|uniref:GTP-binding protein HSR1 n=1 Tax=candidate division LCP-89 bacterium B3_LCP TaxID=2012998 RepID=A0A532V4M4_UNCL8|nr:MAG: GTP-binding protein HSR1 [candidate division LCP-89 bacterium B3_LCP]
MPTNLPPEYFEVERRYKAASSPQEKISTLEELIATIPKHKGTDHLRADLRRKLSKLKDAAQASKKKGRQTSSFQIDREGAGRVALVGCPNVGKSSLLTNLTNAKPKVDQAPFTTWVPTPGMMLIENIQVQLIDTPPLSREYMEPELRELIRGADLMIILLDLQDYPIQQLEDSVEILKSHRIEVSCTENEPASDSSQDLHRPLIVVNKHDDWELDKEFGALCELYENECSFISMSTKTGRNVHQFKQAVYEALKIVRIYSKRPGKEPNLEAPFVMKKGGTVEEFAGQVHKDFLVKLKTARLWGSGAFDGQQVSRDYVLQDGDVVELVV